MPPRELFRRVLRFVHARRRHSVLEDESWASEVRLESSRRKALGDLADILLPRGGSFHPGGADVAVVEGIENSLDLMPKRLQKRVATLITYWDLAPYSSRRFRKPFHRLERAEQERWVAHVDRSHRLHLKLPFIYLKQLIFLAFASTPEVEDFVGFDYTCRRDGEVHGRRKTRETRS